MNPRQIDTSFSKSSSVSRSSFYFFLHCLSPETLFPFPLYLYVEKRLQDFDHFRFQWLSLCQVKPSQSLYSKHLFFKFQILNFKYFLFRAPFLALLPGFCVFILVLVAPWILSVVIQNSILLAVILISLWFFIKMGEITYSKQYFSKSELANLRHECRKVR